MANRRKPTIEKVCPVCKETFLVCPSLAKRVCCSCECKGIASRGPRHLIDKLCHNCGKQFQVRPHENKRKYCSLLCSNTHITKPGQDSQRKHPVKPLLTKTCRHCEQTFETKSGKQIFCSKDCHLNHTRRKSHKCLQCGIVYVLGRHHNQYCSNECRSLAHRVPRIQIRCATCDKPMRIRVSQSHRKQYCSHECQFTNMHSSAEEQLVLRILSSLLGEQPTRQLSFPWLTNPSTSQRMRLDAYFPNHNLAVEYDGKMHRKFIKFFHSTEQEFLDLQQRDRIKEQLVREHGMLFMRIVDTELRTAEHFKQRLDSLLALPTDIQDGNHSSPRISSHYLSLE